MRLKNTGAEVLELPLIHWVTPGMSGSGVSASIKIHPGDLTEELEVLREQVRPTGALLNDDLLNTWLDRYPQLKKVDLQSRYDRLDDELVPDR